MTRQKRNRRRVLRARKSARYDHCEHGYDIWHWKRCPKCRAYTEASQRRWAEFEKTPEWQARIEAASKRTNGLLFPELHAAEPEDDYPRPQHEFGQRSFSSDPKKKFSGGR